MLGMKGIHLLIFPVFLLKKYNDNFINETNMMNSFVLNWLHGIKAIGKYEVINFWWLIYLKGDQLVDLWSSYYLERR